MTVTIPEELDAFVQAKVRAGEFATPEAVVAAALSAWQGQESYTAVVSEEAENLLLEAIDSPRTPGKDEDLDNIVAGLRKKYSA